MKKLILIISLIVSVLFLAACVDSAPVQSVDTPAVPSPTEQTQPSPVPDVVSTPDAEPPTQNNIGRVGETLESDGLMFTFDSIEEYVDEGELFRDTPDDGKEYIVLWFSVRNSSDEDNHVNMFYEDSYLDGFSISQELLFFNIDGETIWGDLAAGRARRGYVGYEVPIGWSEIEFTYSPLFAAQDSKLVFSASNDEVVR